MNKVSVVAVPMPKTHILQAPALEADLAALDAFDVDSRSIH